MRSGGIKIEVKISSYKFNCNPQLTNGPMTSHGRGHKKITIFSLCAWAISYVTNLKRRIPDNLCSKVR